MAGQLKTRRVAALGIYTLATLFLLNSSAYAACNRGELMTWCADSPLESDRDLWSQSMAVDENSGAVYVGGHFASRTKFHNTTVTAKSSLDVFIMKEVGKSVEWVFAMTPWATQGGDDLPIGFMSEYMKVHSVAVDPTGSLVYVTGHYSGVVEANGKQILRSMEEISQDVFLLQLDAATGSLNWVISVGGDSIDSVHGLTVDDDSVYVSGSFFHMAEFGKQVLYTPHGFEGAFVLRVSAAGAIVWAQSVEYLLPDFELADVRSDSIGLVKGSNLLRVTGSLGAPKTTGIATTKSMPSMYTTLMDKRTGTYVEHSQNFFAYFSSTLMSVDFDPEDNAIVSVFWCDEANEGVVVDAGHALWCTDHHEKVMALKLDLADKPSDARVVFLSELADAFVLGNGRFLDPSVSIAQAHGNTYLVGSFEGMVTFADEGSRTVRSSTPRVFLAHFDRAGAVKGVEVLGNENGVMLVTGLSHNKRTGAIDFTGVFKGLTSLGAGLQLKASTPEKWDVYTANVVQTAANVDLFDLYSDTASNAVMGASSITGTAAGVLNTLLQVGSNPK